MLLMIWGIPFILACVTSIYFNKRSTSSPIMDKFKLYTTLDVIKTYLFMMSFLSLITAQNYAISIIMFVFVVVGILAHLYINYTKEFDQIVTFETFKNNVIVQMTTFVPFLVFLYFFRDINYGIIRFFLAIICTGILFGASFKLKELSYNVIDTIKLKISLSFERGLLLLLFLTVVSFVLIISFVATTAKLPVNGLHPYSYEYKNEGRLGYEMSIWDNHEITQSKILRRDTEIIAKTTLLSKDINDKEYLTIINHTDGYFLPYSNRFTLGDYNDYTLLNNTRIIELSTISIPSTEGNLNYTGDIIEANYIIVPSSTGAYYIAENDSGLLAGTEGKETYYVFHDDSKYILIKESDKNYTLLNLTESESIAISGPELLVINDTLFIHEGNHYTSYFDNTISFEKVTYGTPYYFSDSRSLIQVTYEKDNAIIYNSLNSNEPLRIKIGENETVVPLPGSTYYNFYQFSYQNKIKVLSGNLRVYSHKYDNDIYESFLIYNKDSHKVYIDHNQNIDVMHITSTSKEITLNVSTYNFLENSESLSTNMLHVVCRFSAFILLFLFVPITNDYEYIVVDDFLNRTRKLDEDDN